MVNQDPSQKGPVRKLGRGLNALLGSPVQIQVPGAPAARSFVPQLRAPMAPVSVEPPAFEPADHEQAAGGATMALREIAVDQIVPNRRQPRTDFDEASLSTLAASIQSAGLMQPIMVRPRLNGYELVAGERRWRAAKLIGLKTIPALVKVVDDQLAAELALVENIQREDLNPMDRAHALRRLAQEFSLTHQQIADKVGLDRASITNLLRLSDLDGGTADLVRSGRLSQGHAKALLGVTDIGARAMFAAKAIAEEWSVRELERRVQVALKGGRPISEASPKTSSTDPSARDANVTDLERQLAEHLGTRVSLQLGRKKGSGRLTIEFYNLDQFDGLMLKMGFGGR